MSYVLVVIALFSLRYFATFIPRLSMPIYYLVLLGLFLFSAFRFEVGCDWLGYLNQYLVAGYESDYQLLGLRDPLWSAIINLLNENHIPYPWLNVVSSLLFFSGMHVLARRQPDPLGFLVLLLPVLIINMPMSGIRQASAVGIMGFAFVAFLDRRLLLYILWVLVATGIHSSAAVWLLLTPLVRGEYGPHRLLFAGFLAVPGLLLLLSGEAASVAVSRYVGSGVDAAGAVFRILLVSLTAAFYLLFLAPRWKQFYPGDFKLTTTLCWVMLAALLLLPLSSVIGDRMTYYLVPVQTMIFARLSLLGFTQHRALWALLPYAGLTLFFVVWVQYSAHFYACYVPYKTWLFGFPEITRGFGGRVFPYL